MRLLLLGASGATGQHVLRQALARDHDVTALVRRLRLEALPPEASRARVVAGDVLDPASLAEAMAAQDAVISTLGVGKSFKSNGLIAAAVPNLVAAMKQHGVRRIVFTSAFGVGETWRDAPLLPRLFMRTLLRKIYADKAAGEAVLKQSDLDWTIVHPTGLTDKPGTGRYRVGERLALRGFPTIPRADVAACLLRELEERGHVRKAVLVSS
jgi:putative NADH-flavin reductase